MSDQKPTLSHLDEQGRANMVDIGPKGDTERVAVAVAHVVMAPETVSAITDGAVPKGDVFAVARVAGIQAAKQTSQLIPLCHPLMLTSIEVNLRPDYALPGVAIEASCRLRGKTGVEMEALTAASVAALTIYDMCKAIDRGMVIQAVRLEYKEGGASGRWVRSEQC